WQALPFLPLQYLRSKRRHHESVLSLDTSAAMCVSHRSLDVQGLRRAVEFVAAAKDRASGNTRIVSPAFPTLSHCYGRTSRRRRRPPGRGRGSPVRSSQEDLVAALARHGELFAYPRRCMSLAVSKRPHEPSREGRRADNTRR